MSRIQAPDVGRATPAELLTARASLRMHPLDGLALEGVALRGIAASLGTPCWVYGAGTLRARYRALAGALAGLGAQIHYAVKANDHLAVLRVLAAEGAGADVVSGGEFARARLAGIDPRRIVFSGVGKTRAELAQALAHDIAQINVESAEELDMVAAVAQSEGRIARVVLRINPDISAGAHDKISTGRAGDKFGVPIASAAELYCHAASLAGVRPLGLALHIGSQISSIAPYRAAYTRAASLIGGLRAEGFVVERLDCGGGLGISYADEPAASPAAYAGVLRATVGDLGLQLQVEPGRWLVGPAGVLLCQVILVKHAMPRDFVVVDAAMNDLARPAIYDAWHGVVPLAPHRLHAPLTAVDVVGPICESSDFLARARLLPALAEGDQLALLDTGAYGAVMSSTYNARPLAPQALVDDGGWTTIRQRQPLASLWSEEIMPPHLRPPQAMPA